MKKKRLFSCAGLVLLNLIFACSSDDAINEKDGQAPKEEVVEEEEVEPETPMEIMYPIKGDTGKILLHDRTLSKEGYVLVNEAAQDRVYLMEKDSARIVHEWQLQFDLGNDVELMPDGKLLASLGVDSPDFYFGGFGGVIQIINPDSSVDWEFTYANEEHLIHHDVEMLPNGNILAIVWDVRYPEELSTYGYLGAEEKVYTESIIEINPITSEIIWLWDSWDHIVQDVDDTKTAYGNINEHPELININYIDLLRQGLTPDGDIMHANGLDYDEENDLIYLSVNNFSEVWVIDHSTTMSEVRTNSGGNYGKGGDLIYRFGNPRAYNNTFGKRLFYNNHFPNLLEDKVAGEGNILIFANGNDESMQSKVYELKIPVKFELQSDIDNELDVVWSYTREDLYSPKVSGAIRLDNGNTLITSGTSGCIEVTSDNQVVWEFKGIGFFWRSYHYNFDSSATTFLDFEIQ